MRTVLHVLMVFAVVWIILGMIVEYWQRGMMDYQYAGFPWKYREGGGICVYGPCEDVYDYVALGGDVAVWLAVSWALVRLILRGNVSGKHSLL